MNEGQSIHKCSQESHNYRRETAKRIVGNHKRFSERKKEKKIPTWRVGALCSPVHRGFSPPGGFWYDGVVRLPGYWGRGWTHLDSCPSEGDTRSADSLDTKHEKTWSSVFEQTPVEIPIWALDGCDDWYAFVLNANSKPTGSRLSPPDTNTLLSTLASSMFTLQILEKRRLLYWNEAATYL